jgi:hypothetical protein
MASNLVFSPSGRPSSPITEELKIGWAAVGRREKRPGPRHQGCGDSGQATNSPKPVSVFGRARAHLGGPKGSARKCSRERGRHLLEDAVLVLIPE